MSKHTLVQRLNAALCRGTGTQLSPDEVKTVRAMLEALRSIDSATQPGLAPFRNVLHDWAKSAIAKAEGRP